MIEVALFSFAAILVAWIVAPGGARARRAETKVPSSVVPAQA
jgi:hypothetical protein